MWKQLAEHGIVATVNSMCVPQYGEVFLFFCLKIYKKAIYESVANLALYSSNVIPGQFVSKQVMLLTGFGNCEQKCSSISMPVVPSLRRRLQVTFRDLIPVPHVTGHWREKCVCVCVCGWVGGWMGGCVHVCACVCVCGCMCGCGWVDGWVHACVCVCVCVCVQ